MSEELTKPFIITLSFVAITALLISVTSEVQSFNYNTKMDETLEGWETIGGFDLNWWENEDDLYTGYDVDPTDTEVNDLSGTSLHPEDWFRVNYDHEADFYKFDVPYAGSLPGVRVFLIRNSPYYEPGSIDIWEQSADFFILSRQTQDWPFPNVRVATIPFEDVVDADIEANSTFIQCRVGQLTNVTMFINATSNLTTALYNDDNYTIRLGTPYGAQLGVQSLWVALGQVLTLRLPDTHWMVNVLLAIPLWAGIGFLAFTLITRVIPFLGD